MADVGVPGRREMWVGEGGTFGALDEDMAALSGQLTAIVAYARRWVCQRAGFEPSPLCLLRPLADVLDGVGDGFAHVGRTGRADWRDLRGDVRRTDADLMHVDHGVAASLPPAPEDFTTRLGVLPSAPEGLGGRLGVRPPQQEDEW